MPTKLDAEAALKKARAFLDTPEFHDAFRPGGGSTLNRGWLKHDSVVGWGGLRGNAARECRKAKLSKLIKLARGGDADADAALCDIARDFLKGNLLPPKPLTNYLAKEVLTKPASKPRLRTGPKPNALKIRNGYIAEAVDRVAKRGFKPNRNPASRSDGHPASACSIVAKTLIAIGCPIGEEAVEKIVRGARKAQSKRRKN